jgi:hypothetical protein
MVGNGKGNGVGEKVDNLLVVDVVGVSAWRAVF